MAYTTNELIADAYYMSDIVAREFDAVSGTQAAEGLKLLNFILNRKTADKGMIPYISTYNDNFVIGQEEYFISNLIEVYTLTYLIDDVRFNAQKVARDMYFGSARANDIDSLPFSYHVQRELGGSRLYVYFNPSQAFPFELKALFRLGQVTQFQDLFLTLEQNYIDLLTYELAQSLCDRNGFKVSINISQRLAEIRKEISKMSQPLDMSIKRVSALSPTLTVNYAYANLGTGFVPSIGRP